jgi:3-dehydroquinate synthase
MKPILIPISFSHADDGYDVVVGGLISAGISKWAKACVGNSVRRVQVVSNPKVFRLYGETVTTQLKISGFDTSVFLMPDGERFKSLRTAEKVMQAFAENGITRSDAVVALGGGVVGDLAGFAAAVYLRGISFLQVPTTLLAMVDSSVGGKTGVNSSFGKNRVGAFHQPRGVFIDPHVLSTLPPREMTAGLCEIIKHAAIGGRELLKQTREVLTEYQERPDSDGCRAQLAHLIAANVRLKASIVAGDEREDLARVDPRSRKILNFGHTLGHALEKVTDYKYFKHGEAVGYGILFAAELSKNLALLSQKDVNSLNDVVQQAGKLPLLTGIHPKEVLDAFRFDKKHLSGSLQMVLLKGIGKPMIVNDVPRQAFRKVLDKLIRERS